MEGITLIIALAIVIEALVEYAKSIGKAFVDGERKTAVTQLCALAISMAICFLAQADLFAVVGIEFLWPPLGTLLTGIFASRGANFVSDLIGKLNK